MANNPASPAVGDPGSPHGTGATGGTGGQTAESESGTPSDPRRASASYGGTEFNELEYLARYLAHTQPGAANAMRSKKQDAVGAPQSKGGDSEHPGGARLPDQLGKRKRNRATLVARPTSQLTTANS